MVANGFGTCQSAVSLETCEPTSVHAPIHTPIRTAIHTAVHRSTDREGPIDAAVRAWNVIFRALG
jgi:hypothetical protein